MGDMHARHPQMREVGFRALLKRPFVEKGAAESVCELKSIEPELAVLVIGCQPKPRIQATVR